uniref:Uncharacterized protein n=1 Tax=Panagrolaimus sp. JU765 TaxID=591449 RepID=A0AC34QF70_9BILA
MWLSILASLAVFFPGFAAVQVPQCNRVEFFLNASFPDNNQVFYRLNFTVDVKKSSQEFHNDVTLSKFSRWALNDSYYESWPLEFFAEVMDVGILCNSTMPVCEFKGMRDGLAAIMLSLQNGPFEEVGEWFLNFWFIEGTTYNSRAGQMFDPVTDRCFHDHIDFLDLIFDADYCCVNFTNVQVPDPPINAQKCVEFYGETNFTGKSGDLVSQVGVLYSVSDNFVNASVNKYSGPSDATFNLSPNSDEYVLPCTDNSVEYPCVVTQPVNDTRKDHTYNFVIDVWRLPYYDYSAINGQLISRKGVWMKNVARPTPYTVEDPCWTRVVDANNDTTASTNFCCKKWAFCAEYRTKTTVTMGSTNIAYLSVNVVLDSNQTMRIQMANYTTTSNNIKQNVQFESLSSNGQAQFCRANSTSLGNSCLFQEFAGSNYTFSLRNSDFPDGWNMVNVAVNGQQIISPFLTLTNPCHSEVHNYNGVDQKTTAKTEICCISAIDGPWPGSM